MTTTRELALLRLVAQRLVGPPHASAGDAVRHLLAAQGQDYRGALTSIALRTSERTQAGVIAALDAGEVVRGWPMRGTLHLVAAEDLPWLLELTTERLIAGAARRRAQLDLDERIIERAREEARGALTGGGRLSRAELLTVWNDAGISTDGQRGYHLIWHLAQTGTLCFGPTLPTGEQLLVLLAEWAPAPPPRGRADAVAELARRYFAGHGPATVKDLGWWSGLRMSEVRAGLEVARPRLEAVIVDGTEYLMDPATPQLLAEHRRAATGVLLLPGFDEFILGYTDRTAALPAEHFEKIVPGRNGVFRGTVVARGQVVGTWRNGGRGSAKRVEASAFTSFTKAVEEAVPRRYAALPRG